MKKKLIWILCLLGIFLFIPIPVSATGSAPLLVDHVNLLADMKNGMFGVYTVSLDQLL